MRLKYILYTIALCCLFSVATAKAQISKEIMTVLDNTSANIKKCGNVKATFTATQFNKKEPQGSTNGMVCISGNKAYPSVQNTEGFFIPKIKKGRFNSL